MRKKLWFSIATLLPFYCSSSFASTENPKIIYFKNGSLVLGGEIFVPDGQGPFPALLYNHGSAPGMLNSQASRIMGPLFAQKGWIFFMSYRRGQGLSADAGEYIGDQIRRADQKGGQPEAVATMLRLLAGEQLSDQMAALKWLREQSYVQKHRIAVAGNSFGGIETILGASQEPYCAAIDASGGAESWQNAPALQSLLKDTVRKSKAPIFFFQAENDYDLSPSKALSAEMTAAGKVNQIKIYRSYGKTNDEGHSFAYRGASVWFDDVFNFIQAYCH